jgi:hypothetical protein
MNHTQVIALSEFRCFRRDAWPEAKKVRAANIADMDFINVTAIDNVYVEDCPKKMDCQVRIWNPTKEDLEADDYEIVECKK